VDEQGTGGGGGGGDGVGGDDDGGGGSSDAPWKPAERRVAVRINPVPETLNINAGAAAVAATSTWASAGTPGREPRATRIFVRLMVKPPVYFAAL